MFWRKKKQEPQAPATLTLSLAKPERNILVKAALIGKFASKEHTSENELSESEQIELSRILVRMGLDLDRHHAVTESGNLSEFAEFYIKD